MMKNFLFVFVALALVPSLALAGGGTKASGTINVKNNGSLVMGVIVDPPSTLDPTTATEAQFTAAGGKFVNAGATGTFTKLKAGNHTVVVFQVTDMGIGEIGTKTYNLLQAKTLNVAVTFDANGVATFSP
ncbi:MAG: hypothetical protein K8R36_09065 [Planctomycetales bacterium]|nr:hypothetical protein [Planctomycetales bacterium]